MGEKSFARYNPSEELDMERFVALWSELGFPQQYACAYFAAVDKSGDERINYQELLAGLTVLSGSDHDATACLLMQIYDTDHSGFIDASEFKAALTASHKVVKAAVVVALAPVLRLASGVSQLVSADGCEAPEVPDVDVLMEIVGELPLPAPEDFGKAFKLVDTNRDRRLSLDEIAAGLRRSEVQKWLLPHFAAKDVSTQLSECPCCTQ